MSERKSQLGVAVAGQAVDDEAIREGVVRGEHQAPELVELDRGLRAEDVQGVAAAATSLHLDAAVVMHAVATQHVKSMPSAEGKSPSEYFHCIAPSPRWRVRSPPVSPPVAGADHRRAAVPRQGLRASSFFPSCS